MPQQRAAVDVEQRHIVDRGAARHVNGVFDRLDGDRELARGTVAGVAQHQDEVERRAALDAFDRLRAQGRAVAELGRALRLRMRTGCNAKGKRPTPASRPSITIVLPRSTKRAKRMRTVASTDAVAGTSPKIRVAPSRMRRLRRLQCALRARGVRSSARRGRDRCRRSRCARARRSRDRGRSGSLVESMKPRGRSA